MFKEMTFIRTNGKIINPVDLIQMRKNASSYTKFSEIKEDLSWFKHNCEILHGSSYSIINGATELLKTVDEEIIGITECHECYAEKVKDPVASFVVPCKRIHPVVWAKSDGFQYWAAKAMYCENGEVHVRYFGDHSADDIPIGNCYQYSAQPPDESCNSDLFEIALEVC